MIVHFKKISRSLGYLSVTIGALVLMGWWQDIAFFQRFSPQLRPMQTMAAWCFVICGLSIASFGQRFSVLRILLRVAMAGVFVVGLLNMFKYFLYNRWITEEIDLSIKMSMASGLLFCLLSAVLLNRTSRYRYAYNINLVLIFLGTAVSLLAITGYILDYQAMYSLLPFSTMAPQTAVTFILLFAGAFLSIGNNTVLDLIAAYSLGGKQARTLLPVGLCIPVVLGLLLLLMVRLHFFSIEVGFIILVFLCSIIITSIVYQNSKLIHQGDVKNQKTLVNMELLNRQLFKLNKELKQQEQELLVSNESLLAEKEALESTNDTLDTFVYAASHDLRSPVQNMKALHRLMHIEEDESMKEKYLKALEASTHRLENTIDGLMGIVALQSSDQVNAERLQFRQILDMVLEDCILQKHEQVIAQFDNAPEIVYIKPYLQSILRNLVTNAIKYKDPNRALKLLINTRKHGNRVTLRVQDNGIGMNMKRYGHLLFQPFKRFSDQAAGSGIGLYLIKSMIEKNEGTIRVESEPGEGTIFYCELIAY